MLTKAQEFLSLIIHSDNIRNIEQDLQACADFMANSFEDFEILIISESTEIQFHRELEKYLSRIPAIRHLIISHIKNQQSAYAAGMENAIGDFIITFSPCNDPLAIITDSLKLMQENELDLIIGKSKIEKSLLYSLISKITITLLAKIMRYRYVSNQTNFRVMTRSLLNSILNRDLHHNNLFYHLDVQAVEKKHIDYQTLGSIKRTMLVGLSELHSILINNSIWPLRTINLIGLFGSFLSLAISLYVFIVNLIKNDVVEGWTSLSLFVSTQMFFIFLILIIFGEYLARIVSENKNKRDFEVLSEASSNQLINTERLNVIYERPNKEGN